MGKKDVKEIKSLDDLAPDKDNANKGTERGGYMLDHSLEEYGAGRSVLADKHGNIIAGNQATGAANAKGFGVKVVQVTGDELVVVQRTDLDLYDEEDHRARGLALADNRVAQVNLSWDAEAIARASLGGSKTDKLWFPTELDQLQDAGAGVPVESPMQDDSYIDASVPAEEPLETAKDAPEMVNVIVIMCTDEDHQAEVFDAITELGYDCKAHKIKK